MTGAVRRESVDGVLVVTIDRPLVRNSLDLDAAVEFAAALDELDESDTLRVAVITGAGGTFCAGMDLKAFAATGLRPEVPGRGFAGITRRPPRKPVIAAVEGHAVGGGLEVVLSCDLVVAASDAVFALPEARRGLVAGSGGLLRLPRRVPVNVAMELGLTGRPFSAQEAHAWGLVNRVADPGHALDAALELAREILAAAPLSVETTKRLIAGPAAALPWDEAFAEQDRLLDLLAASDDAHEGAAAFVDRRPPIWTGRRPAGLVDE